MRLLRPHKINYVRMWITMLLDAIRLRAAFFNGSTACFNGSSAFLLPSQTTCWLLNAVWLIHMGAFLYLMPGRHGLHSVVWHDTPDVHETVNTYLAVDVWVCTVCTVCMHMQLHNSGGARSSFQVHAQGSAANYAKLPPNGEHVMREDLETAAEAALHMNGDDARLASAQT
uniref:Uncharacterized protein n=1 Tax=Chrysotila carterae TaxID=13221 RepID=A0A7S4B5M5_CHRCT